MSVEWVAVLVAVVAAGITSTGLAVSGFRRLADQIVTVDHRLADQIATVDQRLTDQIAGVGQRLKDQIAAVDQRLGDRLGGVEQQVSFLAGLLEGTQHGVPVPSPEAAE